MKEVLVGDGVILQSGDKEIGITRKFGGYEVIVTTYGRRGHDTVKYSSIRQLNSFLSMYGFVATDKR